eukprot:CFRG0395T1
MKNQRNGQRSEKRKYADIVKADNSTLNGSTTDGVDGCNTPKRAKSSVSATSKPLNVNAGNSSSAYGRPAAEILSQFLLSNNAWTLMSCIHPSCTCTAYSNSTTSTKNTSITAKLHISQHVTTLPRNNNAAVCIGCGHGPASHSLNYTDHMDRAKGGKVRTNGFRGLCLLFEAIRNARAYGNVTHIWGSGWMSSTSQAVCCKARAAVIDAIMLCRGLRNDTELYSSNTVTTCLKRVITIIDKPTVAAPLPSKLRGGNGVVDYTAQARGITIAAELDIAYWHVIYSAQTYFSEQSVSHLRFIIPAPEVYFSCLTHSPPTNQAAKHNRRVLHAVESTFDLHFDEHTQAPLYCDLANPLLAVLQSTWVELEICACAADWVPYFPLKESLNEEKTLRGVDPLLPQPIAERCDSVRDWSARLMAFAVPNREACEALAKFDHLLEIGAGVGYWKRTFDRYLHIKGERSASTAGVDRYVAYDKVPPPFANKRGVGSGSGIRGEKKGTMNEYHGFSSAWAPVRQGTTQSLSLAGSVPGINGGGSSMTGHSSKIAVVSCYPPPNETLAIDCLRYAEKLGAAFVYIGEFNGDTGTTQFQQMLTKSWKLSQSVNLPCFSNTANFLKVYLKNSSPVRDGKVSVSLFTCSADGCTNNATRRCRRTRESCYCSRKCYHNSVIDGRFGSSLAIRHIHISSGVDGYDFDSDSGFRSLTIAPVIQNSRKKGRRKKNKGKR